MALAEIPARRLLLLGGRRGFAGGVDPNWWKRFQFGGVLPTVVMDFANGLYYDGAQTSTDPAAFVSNGTVTAGSGLLCNAANITAKGALLAAFQGASGYNAQIATFGAPAAAGANVGMLADDHTNGIFMNAASGGFLTWNQAAGSALQDSAGFDWTKTCWGSLSTNGSTFRRLSSLGPGAGTTGATGNHLADANGYASPATIFLGSWNSGFTFQGFIAQLAVCKNNPLADRVIPPAAFTGTNGWWWNGDAANSRITYGNVLAYEYTQPWTLVAAICCFAAAGGGHAGVSGIVFTNVTGPGNAAQPGYEFWPDGNGHMTIRVIHVANTAWIDVNGGTFIADGKWRVVAASYDGSGRAAGCKIYVDGMPETITVNADSLGGGSIISTYGANPNGYVIGNQQGQSFGNIGAIGLFRQFNRVLSQSEIQKYKINMTLPPIDSSCVLAPALNEGGSSTTTADLSASGLTGTLNSASCWLRG